jgi:hypothetical protein
MFGCISVLIDAFGKRISTCSFSPQGFRLPPVIRTSSIMNTAAIIIAVAVAVDVATHDLECQ